uniref:Amino acid transporter n=1 Tax=Chromera velia CCMP2878 TaxID=1169474 RepID=A0A0G4IEJ0_9ALVE|eukprot:Cvel_2389.t1-p1 / transcript=Cvel_2389.t1 / gene=Cvel_2389 / organism=Chromera_velia_CCMP2878 / gene_product=Proton/sodium-glutamate symport protein, putative / transcript_product=Proton/sodium-glutamate symport protein, putative / location=Cvel_scaffold93:5367-8385(-) / protein_length=643 / sequence_SO=supercontig / SO=protein_coding / is_pseudo=false
MAEVHKPNAGDTETVPPPSCGGRLVSVLKVWQWPVWVQALGGIVLGIVLGFISGFVFREDFSSDRWDMQILDVFGTLFLNGLKMTVVPLIFASLVISTSSMGEQKGCGRLALKTISFYLFSSLVAGAVGLIFVNVLQPGRGTGLGSEADEEGEGKGTEGGPQRSGGNFREQLTIIDNLIPANVVQAAASDNLLGIIFFAILFGIVLGKLENPDQKRTALVFLEAVYNVMLRIVGIVLAALPIGVVCLVAPTMAETFADQGVEERLRQIALFLVTVLAGLLTYTLVVLPLVVLCVGRNPIRHLQAVLPALLTALSTSSSSGTLPLSMKNVRERAGVSERITNFVLPLGATVNMNGTALYECVVVVFLAQVYGINLGITEQVLAMILALLTSVGVAGVPAASLVAILIVLQAVNSRLSSIGLPTIPESSIVLIVMVDRPLDMLRTAVNVLGDTVTAVMIARTEGERMVLSLRPKEMEVLVAEKDAEAKEALTGGKDVEEGGGFPQIVLSSSSVEDSFSSSIGPGGLKDENEKDSRKEGGKERKNGNGDRVSLAAPVVNLGGGGGRGPRGLTFNDTAACDELSPSRSSVQAQAVSGGSLGLGASGSGYEVDVEDGEREMEASSPSPSGGLSGDVGEGERGGRGTGV